jgi:hypothetical protein
MGLVMASTRVYVNEGSAHDLWVTTWALNPFDIKESVARNFKPGEFDLISTARNDPNSPWMQTENRTWRSSSPPGIPSHSKTL